jgi:hypothetical protein
MLVKELIKKSDKMKTMYILFQFSTYDLAYAQFCQDPLGSLKIAFLQRRNM